MRKGLHWAVVGLANAIALSLSVLVVVRAKNEIERVDDNPADAAANMMIYSCLSRLKCTGLSLFTKILKERKMKMLIMAESTISETNSAVE